MWGGCARGVNSLKRGAGVYPRITKPRGEKVRAHVLDSTFLDFMEWWDGGIFVCL